MDLNTIHKLAKDPEYRSVEEFIQFCLDDDRDTFTHVELRALALNIQKSGSKVRAELESYGLALMERAFERKIRGFGSNSHDRWSGPGACKSHGGSGSEQINGFAGRVG